MSYEKDSKQKHDDTSVSLHPLMVSLSNHEPPLLRQAQDERFAAPAVSSSPTSTTKSTVRSTTASARPRSQGRGSILSPISSTSPGSSRNSPSDPRLSIPGSSSWATHSCRQDPTSGMGPCGVRLAMIRLRQMIRSWCIMMCVTWGLPGARILPGSLDSPVTQAAT